MSGMPLALDAVRIVLAGRELVPTLTMTVAPGECVTVMGPSGAGKSTLLAFIAGTLAPAFHASGRVQLGARDVTAASVLEALRDAQQGLVDIGQCRHRATDAHEHFQAQRDRGLHDRVLPP